MRPRTIKRSVPTLGGWPASKLALWFFSGLAMVSLLLSGIFVQTKANDVTHDKRLVSTVVELESAISDYYDTQDELPDELAEIAEDDDEHNDLVKKANNFSVEYDQKDERNYELCADFRTDESDDADLQENDLIAQAPSRTNSSVYNHDSGRECFDYSVGSSFFRYNQGDSGGDSDSSVDQLEQLFNGASSLN